MPACRQRSLIAALLLLAVLLTYANSLPGAFIGDDHTIVVANPLVNDPGLAAIFGSQYWGGKVDTGLYRPITILSLALNRMVFGPSPWGFHLVNLLLHAGVVVLAWATLERWAFPRFVAVGAALLFALHPMHAEVVNLAVGRSELLAALFMLAALYVLRGAQWPGVGVAAGWFLLALLAKEHAVALLLLWPLFEAFVGGGTSVWRRHWRRYAGFALLVAGWLAWRTWGVASGVRAETLHPVFAPLAFLDPAARALSALRLQAVYLGKLLLPVDLHGVYAGTAFPGGAAATGGVALLVAVAAALCLVLLVVGWRRRVLVALCLGLYAVAFLPTANLLLPIGVSFAERICYFPSLWFCAALAALLHMLWLRGGAWALAAGAVLVTLCGGYGSLTVLRNPLYGSEIRLWQADVTRAPGNLLAWLYLADSLKSAGRLGEAERAYRELTERAPGFGVGWRYLADLLRETGRPGLAIEACQRALQDPHEDVLPVRLILARSYLDRDAYAAALRELEQVGWFYGDHWLYWELTGKALAGLGRYDEAVAAYRRVDVWPQDSDGAVGLGLALAQLGRDREAAQVLQASLRGRDSAAGWNALGVIAARQRRLQEAVDAFRHAVDLAPGNRYYQQNLQRVYQQLDSQ